MHVLGKYLVISGLLLVILGLVFTLGAKVPFPGKLPGDIMIRRENFSFYFPVSTCILVSAVLSLIFYLFSRK